MCFFFPSKPSDSIFAATTTSAAINATVTRFSPYLVNQAAIAYVASHAGVLHFHYCSDKLDAVRVAPFSFGLIYDGVGKTCDVVKVMSFDTEFLFNSTGNVLVHMAGKKQSKCLNNCSFN